MRPDELSRIRKNLEQKEYYGASIGDIIALLDQVERLRVENTNYSQSFDLMRERIRGLEIALRAKRSRRLKDKKDVTAEEIQILQGEAVSKAKTEHDWLPTIQATWTAHHKLTPIQTEWLITQADRWQGQRDPAERHADYTELRVKLYEATGVSPDTPMSYFGLVDLLIRQRDAARELTKILGAKRV